MKSIHLLMDSLHDFLDMSSCREKRKKNIDLALNNFINKQPAFTNLKKYIYFFYNLGNLLIINV